MILVDKSIKERSGEIFCEGYAEKYVNAISYDLHIKGVICDDALKDSYTLHPGEFILREIAGECVLVPTGATSQEFNGMITISDTAKFIWENIEKADSLEGMIQMVLDTYEIDEETARRDTIAFVGALVENGFIECTREDGTW